MRSITTPTTTNSFFTTRDDLTEATRATGTMRRLHAAVNLTDLLVAPHRSVSVTVGVNFTEKTPHRPHALTRGTVLITGDGTLTVRAHTVAHDRWKTALARLSDTDMRLLVPGTTPVQSSIPTRPLHPRGKARTVTTTGQGSTAEPARHCPRDRAGAPVQVPGLPAAPARKGPATDRPVSGTVSAAPNQQRPTTPSPTRRNAAERSKDVAGAAVEEA